jgi:general stress protein 26
MNEDQKHFQDILNDFGDAMLTTFDSDSHPRSRPMRIAEINDENELWFVTNNHSGKVDEIQANKTVAITMQGGGKYLSLIGRAEVVQDRAKLDELWSDAWKIWFPKGKDDPAVTLLRVMPDQGEYWDMSGMNRLRYIYEAGKAYFTGKVIDISDFDMNAKVKL